MRTFAIGQKRAGPPPTALVAPAWVRDVFDDSGTKRSLYGENPEIRQQATVMFERYYCHNGKLPDPDECWVRNTTAGRQAHELPKGMLFFDDNGVTKLWKRNTTVNAVRLFSLKEGDTAMPLFNRRLGCPVKQKPDTHCSNPQHVRTGGIMYPPEDEFFIMRGPAEPAKQKAPVVPLPLQMKSGTLVIPKRIVDQMESVSWQESQRDHAQGWILYPRTEYGRVVSRRRILISQSADNRWVVTPFHSIPDELAPQLLRLPQIYME